MHESRSGGKGWLRFLLIWALFLLILGAVGCWTLYRYLGVYEVTRPDPTMDAFLQETDTEALISLAEENLSFHLTEFEDPLALYRSYIAAIDTSRALNYRQDASSSAEELVYTVRSGPNLLCTVILKPDGDSPGFGRHHWVVSEVRSAQITEILPSVTVQIDSVAGQEILLNQKPVTERYLSGEPQAIPDLTKFEASLDAAPARLRYEIGPLYGDVLVSDAFGNSIVPEDDAGDGFVRYHTFVGLKSLSIRAPEDMEITINDVPLTSQDVTSSSYGVLEGLDLYTQNAACRTNYYHIDGLYLTPVVVAHDADGSEVTPIAAAENSFTFFHKGEAETEELMKPTAERFFNAYMDYSAHAFDMTRFITLLNSILPQSSLYQYVYNSQEAMYWASGTATEYHDLRYENFHKINDYCFVCTVIYSADMTATNWYEQYSYKLENAYELSFVSEGGRWLAGGMNVITAA